MSYTRDREQFIARVVQEGLPYPVACTLLRCATSINRYAELACSSEAADRDRIKCPAAMRYARKGAPCLCDGTTTSVNGVDVYQHADIPRYRLQDWRAEQRAIKAVTAVTDRLYAGRDWRAEELPAWGIVTEGDPRGYTLRVIPPSYAERNKGKDRHNLDAIGVPPRESGIRW